MFVKRVHSIGIRVIATNDFAHSYANMLVFGFILTVQIGNSLDYVGEETTTDALTSERLVCTALDRTE